jgi:hypothetical protein
MLDAKGIVPLNLVRLRILKGSGLRLFGPARFGEDYHLLSDEEVRHHHERLVTLFRTLPFGPFNALAYLVGLPQAKIIAVNQGECALPDSYLNQPIPSNEISRARTSGASSSKRRHDMETIEIMDSEEDEPSPRRRRVDKRRRT